MDDLISRQAAIDAFSCNGSVFTYGDKICKAIVSRIMMLPSAQRTGRWIYNDYGNGCGNWHCSACRKIAIVNGNENFCPNCGARMEEQE